MFTLRTATVADVRELRTLVNVSVRASSAHVYSAEQIQSALEHVLWIRSS